MVEVVERQPINSEAVGSNPGQVRKVHDFCAT